MRKRLLVAAILLSSVVASAALAAPASAVPRAGRVTQTSRPTTLSADIANRRALGLRSDAAYVRTLEAAADRVNSAGTVMTPSEASDHARRLNIQAGSGVALAGAEVQGQPDLGSVYFDQAHGGRLVVNYVRNADQHGRALRLRWTLPAADLVVGTVPFARSFLDAVIDRINRTIPSTSRDAVQSIARDDYQDRVTITVAPGRLSVIQNWVDRTLGSRVPVVVQASEGTNTVAKTVVEKLNASAYSWGPADGGLEIARNIPDDAAHVTVCSTAFYAHQAAKQFILTAGHCAAPGHNGESAYAWWIGNVNTGGVSHTLGPTTTYKYATNHPDDASLIAVDSADKPYAESFDRATNLNIAIGSTSQLGDAHDVSGAYVCFRGVGISDTSSTFDPYTNCGNITSTNVTVTYRAESPWPATTLTHLRQSTAYNYPGMSGGGVSSDYTTHYNVQGQPGVLMPVVAAVGISSGSRTDGQGRPVASFYTQIQYALTDFTGGALSLYLL